MKMRFGFNVLFSVIILFSGCQKDEPEVTEEIETREVASPITQKINTFVQEVMTDVYLWYDKLPVIDIKYETDSQAYFYKLLYSEDKWSYITNDITALENALEGIEKTFGYSLTFGRLMNASGTPTGNYFGIVEFVYPGTPASKAGFKRGDLIVKLNGGDINSDNYRDLLSGTSANVTKGILTTAGITAGESLLLTAEEISFDPVLMYKIIEKENHKIGYLLYTQFISSYNETSLKNAMQYFHDNLITDLIIDLRYNPGGQSTAAQYLCSSVAPLNAVNISSTLVSFQWNSKYQSYWTSKNREDQLGIKFDAAVPVKLNLSKIHILTGYGSASASELTITGLEPYMDVTLVGDTTSGKYTGSITIKPVDWYANPSEYTGFKNWGMQPVVIRYANANGVTNFKNGFAPDFRVNDELLPAYPLGDLTEPLLRKAVENITGVPVAALKKARPPVSYEIIERGSSRFEHLKQNLFLDKPSLYTHR